MMDNENFMNIQRGLERLLVVGVGGKPKVGQTKRLGWQLKAHHLALVSV